MDGYTRLIKSISVGHDSYSDKHTLTKEAAEKLLIKAAEKLNMQYTRNGCYEGLKFFAYVGGFPECHVGIDNKAGTDRRYSLFSETDLEEAIKDAKNKNWL